MTSDTGELRRLITQLLLLEGWTQDGDKWSNRDFFAKDISLSSAAKKQLAENNYVSGWPGGTAA